MSDPIEHLYTLHNNPFLFAATLHVFYENLGLHEHSVLLAYLVLPIVLEQKNRDFLCKAKSTSSLRTMQTRRDLLTTIPQRLEDYRHVTTDTVKYLISAHILEIDGATISIGRNKLTDQTSPLGAVAAARRLATFFKPFDVPTIYRSLGVMHL